MFPDISDYRGERSVVSDRNDDQGQVVISSSVPEEKLQFKNCVTRVVLSCDTDIILYLLISQHSVECFISEVFLLQILNKKFIDFIDSNYSTKYQLSIQKYWCQPVSLEDAID